MSRLLLRRILGLTYSSLTSMSCKLVVGIRPLVSSSSVSHRRFSSALGFGRSPWLQAALWRPRSVVALEAVVLEAKADASAAAVDLVVPGTDAAAGQTPAGKIELIMGPMFAGKTTELLARMQKAEADGLSVVLVKSDKDDRYSRHEIVAHGGQRRPCYAVVTLGAVRGAMGEAAWAAVQVVGVDEAQFFPDLAEFATHAADIEGKRVVVAGLDGNFRREVFGQMHVLLPHADAVDKLAAQCAFCMGSAAFSLRQPTAAAAAHGSEILVGGAEKYAAACRRCYIQRHRD